MGRRQTTERTTGKSMSKSTGRRGIRLFMGVRLFMAFGVVIFTSLLFSTAYADELYSGKTFEEKVKLFCEQAKVTAPDVFISMQSNLFLRYKYILILKGETEKERRYLLAAKTIILEIQQTAGQKSRQNIESQEKKYEAFYARRGKSNHSKIYHKNMLHWYTGL